VRTAIIGAGPTGLFLGTAMSRRGHQVTVVDRDPGPTPNGAWPRRGVMQFHHAHGFRGQVVQALQRELPEAYDRWVAAGAEPIVMDVPGRKNLPLGMRSRRETFERALRQTASRQEGLDIRRGHVDAVTASDGRVDGLRVDGDPLPADLVIDASGRAGRVTSALRPTPTLGGPCGIAYVDRQYQLHEDAEPGPLLNPLAWQGDYDGYMVIIFVHEHGIFSVLIVRPTVDRDLVGLRHQEAFEAACRAVPGLAAWTDPERSRPITAVLAGGTLMNYYRGQAGPDGRLALPGLVFAGDSVCTTTPNFGRGVATSLLQAEELLHVLDAHGADLVSVGESFDAWCGVHMRPWVEDHVRMDEALRRRWAGEDVDLSERLPSDLIMAAAQADAEIGPALGPYMAMSAGPDSLDAVEPRARAVYATGWRPAFTPGPSRAELVEVVAAAVPQ
jgi:2-polyprenyl-6-methoxyphenol hydroxylase-like FAD-dependent oxidoreductase